MPHELQCKGRHKITVEAVLLMHITWLGAHVLHEVERQVWSALPWEGKDEYQCALGSGWWRIVRYWRGVWKYNLELRNVCLY